MTEPALTSTAGHALAGTGIMVAGIATGLPADLILPSFVGALWALKTAEQGGPWARVLQVVAGTLFAAWSAHPASLAAASITTASMLPDGARIDPALLRYPLAFAIGWGGLKFGLGRFERLIGGGPK